MNPELYLVVYRQDERELERRLEHRRVVLERAAGTGGPATPDAPVRAGRGRSTRTPGPSAARLAGVLARTRRASGSMSAPSGRCCPA